MLTFFRQVKEDSFGILMPQFLKTLNRKGIASENDLQKSMQRVFRDKLVAGKQHIFLVPGSKRTSIPSGRLARKNAETVYARCIVLQKSALSAETCTILEKGIIIDYNSTPNYLVKLCLLSQLAVILWMTLYLLHATSHLSDLEPEHSQGDIIMKNM